MAEPRIRLQQFARLPQPGRVKTRLQTALSADEACAVHCELLETAARALLNSGLGPVELWLDKPGEHPVVAACLAAGLQGPFLQRGADLGQRMAQALSSGLSRADAVILTGSDCPGLDRHYLHLARAALVDCDVVFGPADDGGFVLIGCRRMVPELFVDVDWGSERALDQSERCVRQRGWSMQRLPSRFDVDTPADLRRWRNQAGRGIDAGV